MNENLCFLTPKNRIVRPQNNLMFGFAFVLCCVPKNDSLRVSKILVNILCPKVNPSCRRKTFLYQVEEGNSSTCSRDSRVRNKRKRLRLHSKISFFFFEGGDADNGVSQREV